MAQNTFIANLKSKELHINTCYWGNLIKTNRGYFDSLKDALYEGYDACGHCLPKNNLMIHHGLLIIHELQPSVEGEYILPGVVLLFSKKELIKGESIKIIIELNQKCFEVLFQGDQDDYVLTVNESGQIFNLQEQDVLKKFCAALNRKFAHKSYDIQKNMTLFIRTATLMLTIPKPFNINKSKTRTPGQIIREVLVQTAFNDAKPVDKPVDGKTVSDFTGNTMDTLDNTCFVQKRRFGPCVFEGESVQGWWTSDLEWKKSWCIVGGQNAEGQVGAGGSTDVFGDIDVFVGWFYKAVDHDMCCRYKETLSGFCADEFIYAMGDFILFAIINSMLPNQDISCNGKNPPEEIKITQEEIQQGHYSYLLEQYSDQVQHPMAGRKIGTPSDWTVDFVTKEWKGEPAPEIDDINVIPNPFSQDTDAKIEFKLVRDKENSDLELEKEKTFHVTIKLYYKYNTNVIRPIAILSQNVVFAIKQVKATSFINWDGRNDSGLTVETGSYTAEFLVNGFSKKTIANLLTFTGVISTDNLLTDITISPNPFSIKHTPEISFRLKQKATVEAYIYHQNWTILSTATLQKRTELDENELHTLKWDCKNDAGIISTNGDYKLKFIVNEKAKVIEGLQKVQPGSSEASGVIYTDELLKDITISPNPFSIKTIPKIRFELSEDAKISIYVFHTRWNNPIKTIIENEFLKAGKHTYKWNCRNNLGVISTNGYYKIRILVNDKARMIDRLQKKWEWQL
jgi:flagellar hook assembly protein FlgD